MIEGEEGSKEHNEALTTDDCVKPKAPAKRKAGRPRKAELESTKSLSKREQSAALRDFRARLLLNPKSPKLIEELFETAFDDEHKNQSVAMKILSDRLMPVAGFTADGKQQAAVSINISGIGINDNTGVTISGSDGSIEDGDWESEED